MRKPHARSVLKTLPHDRQAEIFAHAETHSLAETVAWLAANGIETSDSSLSDWRSWYPVAAKLRKASSMGDTVKDILAELPELNLDEHQVSKAAQAVFEAEAMEAGDSKLFLALRSLRQTDRSLDLQAESGATKARQKDAQIAQKDRNLQLAERRVKLLEENQREAKQKLSALVSANKGGLSAETLKQIEEAAGLL